MLKALFDYLFLLSLHFSLSLGNCICNLFPRLQKLAIFNNWIPSPSGVSVHGSQVSNLLIFRLCFYFMSINKIVIFSFAWRISSWLYSEIYNYVVHICHSNRNQFLVWIRNGALLFPHECKIFILAKRKTFRKIK